MSPRRTTIQTTDPWSLMGQAFAEMIGSPLPSATHSVAWNGNHPVELRLTSRARGAALSSSVQELVAASMNLRRSRRLLGIAKEKVRQHQGRDSYLNLNDLQQWAGPSVTYLALTRDGAIIADFVACESRGNHDERLLLPPCRFYLTGSDYQEDSCWPIINGVPYSQYSAHPHARPRICWGSFMEFLLPDTGRASALTTALLYLTTAAQWRKVWDSRDVAQSLIDTQRISWRAFQGALPYFDLQGLPAGGYSPIEGLDGVIYPDVPTLLRETPRRGRRPQPTTWQQSHGDCVECGASTEGSTCGCHCTTHGGACEHCQNCACTCERCDNCEEAVWDCTCDRCSHCGLTECNCPSSVRGWGALAITLSTLLDPATIPPICPSNCITYAPSCRCFHSGPCRYCDLIIRLAQIAHRGGTIDALFYRELLGEATPASVAGRDQAE